MSPADDSVLLLQLVGPRIALHVAETLADAFGDRFTVPLKLRALAESGKSSVYLPDFSVDPEVIALLAGGDRPSTGPELLAGRDSPRRSGSCWTRGSSRRLRTSTCA
jgi:hypothetical protein